MRDVHGCARACCTSYRGRDCESLRPSVTYSGSTFSTALRRAGESFTCFRCDTAPQTRCSLRMLAADTPHAVDQGSTLGRCHAADFHKLPCPCGHMMCKPGMLVHGHSCRIGLYALPARAMRVCPQRRKPLITIIIHAQAHIHAQTHVSIWCRGRTGSRPLKQRTCMPWYAASYTHPHLSVSFSSGSMSPSQVGVTFASSWVISSLTLRISVRMPGTTCFAWI